MDTACFSALIDCFYAAAVEPERWPEAAAQTATFFASESTTIQLRQGDFSNIALRATTPNYDEAAQRAYTDYFHKLDPFANNWRASGKSGIFAGNDLVDPEAFQKSEIYNDYCSRLGIFHNLGAGVDLASGTTLLVGIHRPVQRDCFVAKDRHLLEFVLPHLSRAAQVHSLLATADPQRRLGCWMLQTLSVSAIAVNEQCRVLFANSAAEELLKSSDGLLVKQGYLTTYDPRQAGALGKAVYRATVIAEGEVTSPGDVLVVKGPDGRRLSVLVAPLRRDDCSYGPTDASAVVFANASRSRMFSATATLGKLYRLTPAEKRLLEALLQGERIAEYANRVGISTNTANTQLKQIFAKTGTSRQSELMRQISSDPVASLVN